MARKKAATPKRAYRKRPAPEENGQLTVEAMTVTPAMAKQWIEATGDQNYRTPAHAKVTAIATDLKHGKWQLNGETIKLAGDVVIDGMHRLYGIVQADVPMQTFVVRGASKDHMLTIDRGRQRTFGQELRYRQVPDWTTAAAVTSQWRNLQDGGWLLDSHGRKKAISDLEMYEWFTRHRAKIVDTARLISEGHNNFVARSFLPGGILGPLLLEGTRQHFTRPRESELARLYCLTLATGDAETNKDPVVALRNRLIKDRASKANRPTIQMQRALAIHAWNLLCQGERIDNFLRYRLTGSHAQEFPEIIQAED